MDEQTPAEPETFTIPLPAPPFPHLPPHDVLFVRHRAEDVDNGREHEDIMLRRVPRETAMRFRAAAGGRGLTHAQYLAALVELHRSVRALADAGDEQAANTLAELALATVTV